MTVTLCDLTQTSEAQRATFYLQLFGERARFLEAHWRWLYRVDAGVGPAPLAALDGDVMVGQAGCIPVRLKVGDRELSAAWFVDYFLLPRYRGTGLGRQLNDAWMARFPHRVTLCNEQSMRVFRKAGWSEDLSTVSQSTWLSVWPAARDRSLPWRAAARVASAVYRPVPALASWRAAVLTPRPVDESVLDLFASVDDASPVSVVRDRAWLRWRLLDCPWRDDLRVFSLDGQHAIVRGFVHHGERSLHVLQVVREERAGSVQPLLDGVVRWATTQRVDVVRAMSSVPDDLPTFTAAVVRRNPIRFATHSDDPEVRAMLASHPMPLQAIDADHDLLRGPDEGTSIW